MRQVVPVVLSVEEFELVCDVVMSYIEATPTEFATKEVRDLHKAVYLRLLHSAYDVKLEDIAERLAAKWTDIDCPKGEYSSSSSPTLAA